MDRQKRRRLEAKGWRVGTVKEFLGLSEAESILIEITLALSDAVRKRRRARRWSQAELAKRMGSSQSRVAKIEASDPGVSMDLLIRALLVLGASRRDLARILGLRAA